MYQDFYKTPYNIYEIKPCSIWLSCILTWSVHSSDITTSKFNTASSSFGMSPKRKNCTIGWLTSWNINRYIHSCYNICYSIIVSAWDSVGVGSACDYGRFVETND